VSDGDPPPDGSHGPHVLVVDVAAPTLDEGDRHHLERVLRLRAGDALTVGDGAGAWRACRLAVEPDPVGEIQRVARPAVSLTVAFALIKGGRPDFVVQKLTELGVDSIVPFVAARSIVRWDDERAIRHLERFRRVAREAVMQSRQPWLPSVDPVADFATVVSLPGAAMADRGGDPVSLERPALLVGPEGGWSDEERRVEVPRVALGPAVLRAETAAVAAGTVLGALRAGLVRPAV
jgi:16S rRNA (uracil1498-N3)-methyltransferase